jgi:hypothetical protein
VQWAAVDPQFGGGYAEAQQLKDAVARSIGNYQALDESSAGNLANAGGRA